MAWRWPAATPTSPTADSGLRIINVANPAAPDEVGFYDTPGYAYGVAVAGSYAYVADWLCGPAHHQRRQPGHARRGRVLRHAGVCLGRGGGGQLRLRRRLGCGSAHHQRRQPGPPAEVGFYDTPGDAYGVAVAAATPTSPTRMRACASSTSPTRPRPTRSGSTTRRGMPMAWRWRAATPTSPIDGAGLRIINVANPAAPDEVGFYDTPGYAYGVAVAGSYAYVADWR